MIEPTKDEHKRAAEAAWVEYPETLMVDERSCFRTGYLAGIVTNRERAEKAEVEMVAQAQGRGAVTVKLGLALARAVRAEARAERHRNWGRSKLRAASGQNDNARRAGEALELETERVVNAERLLQQALREWTPTQGPTDQWLRDAKALLPKDESETTDG